MEKKTTRFQNFFTPLGRVDDRLSLSTAIITGSNNSFIHFMKLAFNLVNMIVLLLLCISYPYCYVWHFDLGKLLHSSSVSLGFHSCKRIDQDYSQL